MRVASGLFVACVLGIGCGDALPHPPYIPQPSEALAVIPEAPPPARVERVPPRPGVRGVVWIDGEWMWRRGRWAWTLGRWVVPPPGAAYAPWTFSRSADGKMFFAAGTWRDAQGNVVDRPNALASATADSVPIIDPEGNTEITGRTGRVASPATSAPAASASAAPAASAPPAP